MSYSNNGFDLGPVLNWLANHRHEVAEKLNWINAPIERCWYDRIHGQEYLQLSKAEIAATIERFPENARRRSTLKQIRGRPPMWFAQGTTATNIKITNLVGEALSATAIVPGYTNTLIWNNEVKEQEIWLFPIPDVDLEVAKFMLTHTLIHEYTHTLINPMWYRGEGNTYTLELPSEHSMASIGYEDSVFMMMFAGEVSRHSPISHYSSAYWPLPSDPADPIFITRVAEELCESVAAYLMGFIYNEDAERSMDPFADRPMVKLLVEHFLNANAVIT